MFEGAGSLVFGGTSKKPSETSKLEESVSKDDDDTHNETNDDNYDPHYEPIIPMPEAIVVSTGEEEEEVMFIERAKLYRWTTNESGTEWKERGVGQFKLLHHPVRGKHLDYFMKFFIF